MPVSLIEGDSLLAVDIGGAATRAVLFDVVEGQYRLVSVGQAPSTAEAPYKDVTLGVRSAIRQVEIVTGRILLDSDEQLITPSNPDGGGVDSFVATLSAGPSLATVVVGLLPDVSTESARRLTETTYTHIADTISLNGRRRADELIDRLLQLRADVVVLTGGTDGGASRSIQKMLEPIGLASHLLPEEYRPAILFAGNHKMEKEVRALLGPLSPSLHSSPNVRPSLETEDIEPAAHELARLFIDVRRKQLGGVDLIEGWSGGHILPTGYAAGRMMRFLSKVYGSTRGILSVDIGVSGTVIAAGFKEKSTLGVYPQFGLGESLPRLLNHTSLQEIASWSPVEIPLEALREYLHQKALYPGAIPATREDMAMSQAIARQALRLAFQAARRDFPPKAAALKPGLTPIFDPILAGGGALSDAPTPGQSLLLLLDALQPVGASTVILDQNRLIPLLGAAAGKNSLLPVQILESGAFMSLGTVVSPVGTAPFGSVILQARLSYEDGTEARAEVKSGSLAVLPLPSGQAARLALKPESRIDAGFGPGREGTIPVSGGTLGVVFDGRGRPLTLPADAGKRREWIKTWYRALGG